MGVKLNHIFAAEQKKHLDFQRKILEAISNISH